MLEDYIARFPWLAQLPLFTNRRGMEVEVKPVEEGLMRRVLKRIVYDGYEGSSCYEETLFALRRGKLEKVDVKQDISEHGQPSLIDTLDVPGEPVETALRGDEEFLVVLTDGSDSGKIEIYTPSA